MEYAPSELSQRERCKVLTSFVLPRPIAWVTTLGPTGVVNAAPFSFFNVFAEDPPLVMFAVNKRPDGRLKDTWVNIKRTAEFVVNLTDEPLARAMHESSGDFPPDIGEPDYLGLKLAPSVDIKPPRRGWLERCMTLPHPIVFLVDVDNTLLDNDGIQQDLKDHLEQTYGLETRERYWRILEDLFSELGYRDYIGALQRYREEHPLDVELLSMSSYLIDYPFAGRLYPHALDVLKRLRGLGPTAILSDG